MAGNTHVPDKLEGYMLQVRHALFELISVDDRIVSVEAYDDVAIETDEIIIAEQTKSVLSSNNPITNRAEAFWKAIYNWCDYIKNGEIPEKALVLKYVVVSSHDIKAGTIPSLFAAAKTGEEAKAALENARKELLGDDVEKKAPISQSLKPYIDFCFAQENESFVLKVISLLQIAIHEDSYDEKLLEKFKRQLIPQEYATELFESMLGWVSDQVHRQTKQNKPAYILSKDYRAALELQIRSRDCKRIWHAVSVQPEDYTTTAEVDRHDIYIKQLELIDIDTSDIFEAASDFLRTRAACSYGMALIPIYNQFILIARYSRKQATKYSSIENHRQGYRLLSTLVVLLLLALFRFLRPLPTLLLLRGSRRKCAFCFLPF